MFKVWQCPKIFLVVKVLWASQQYHNLLNIWNKFQLIKNSCFYFELWALLNCPTFVLEWSHVRIPKPSNQSELWRLGTCLPTRSLSFVLTWDQQQCSLCHKIFCSCFVSFSSVFWKAVNFARIYAGVAAAAGLVELAFCMVFLTHKLHVLKTCLRLAKQGTLPCRPISAVYLQSSNLAGYT